MHNETIVCVSSRAWNSLWGESQKVMERMAKQNRVIFVEPGRSASAPMVSEFKRNAKYFVKREWEQIGENLIRVPLPSSIPVARSHLPRPLLKVSTPLIRQFNAKISIKRIQWALDELDVTDPILWLYSPYGSLLVGQFGEKLACYHNYDEFPNFAGNHRIRDLVREYDNELCRKADVVFTTSRPQKEVREKVNPNTHFVPNGVDFELFNQAMDPDLEVPADMASIKGPIIGFAGVLRDLVDPSLLLQIAKAYPDHSLVLVGPDRYTDSPDVLELRSMSNVHLLGMKPLKDLPKYVRLFDVALIPYALVDHVLSGYPQKLHEYLSAGKSIVATAMPELRPFSDVVRIADSNDHFVSLIPEALADTGDDVVQRRLAVAKENTWDARIETYYKVIQETLDSKYGVSV